MKMIQKNVDGENPRYTRDVYWIRKPVVSKLAEELDLAIKDYKVDHCPDLSFPEAMMALSLLITNKTLDKAAKLEVITDTKVSQESGA